MKHVLFALALALCPALAAAQSGDPITEFSAEDAVMNAAQDEARATLDLFLANALDDDGYGVMGASLKVSFDVGEYGNEIIWVGPFLMLDQGQFIGLLSNQPNYMGDLQAGDQVAFDRDMIRDWSVWGPGEKLYGNYTTRVIAETLPPAEAAGLLEVLSKSPVPADW